MRQPIAVELFEELRAHAKSFQPPEMEEAGSALCFFLHDQLLCIMVLEVMAAVLWIPNQLCYFVCFFTLFVTYFVHNVASTVISFPYLQYMYKITQLTCTPAH